MHSNIGSHIPPSSQQPIGISHTKTVEQITAVAPKQKEALQNERAQFRNFMIHEMTSGKPMDSISDHIFKKLEQNCPVEYEKLKSFETEYPEMMKEIRTKGWKQLKTELQEGMKTKTSEGISYEQLRSELVDAAFDLSVAGLKYLGYENLGKHGSVGTPGADSDIDSPFFSSAKQVDQAFEKHAFDHLMNAAFGSLPGWALDTESYIGQSSGPYAIEKDMKSSEAKQTYSYVDQQIATMQVLQGKLMESHHNPSAWEDYVGKRLEDAKSVGGESYKEATLTALNDLKNLHDEMTVGIEKMVVEHYYKGDLDVSKMDKKTIHDIAEDIKAKEPQNFQKASVNYRIKADIGLSLLMDEDLAKEAHVKTLLEKKLDEVKELKSQKFQRLLNKKETSKKEEALKKEITKLEGDIEKTKIDFYKKGCLRNLCSDEGYMTIGPLFVVVVKKGAQSSARVLDAVQNESEARFAFLRSKEKYQDLIEKAKEQKIPLTLNQLKVAQAGLVLKPIQTESASTQDYLSSLIENLGFYQNHFVHDQPNDLPESQIKSFVKNSKYADRVYVSNKILLDQIDEKTKEIQDPTLKAQLKELRNKVEQNGFAASELEKCKRRILNETTATQLLDTAVSSVIEKELKQIDTALRHAARKGNLSPEEREEIKQLKEHRKLLVEKQKTVVNSMAQMFQRGDHISVRDSREKYDIDAAKKSFSGVERYTIIMSNLVPLLNYKYHGKNIGIKVKDDFQSGMIETSDPRINALARGMAGLPIVSQKDNKDFIDTELKQLSNEADDITLESQGLNTAEGIEKYNHEMEDISLQITDLTNKYVLNKPENVLELSSLQKTWQDAINRMDQEQVA